MRLRSEKGLGPANILIQNPGPAPSAPVPPPSHTPYQPAPSNPSAHVPQMQSSIEKMSLPSSDQVRGSEATSVSVHMQGTPHPPIPPPPPAQPPSDTPGNPTQSGYAEFNPMAHGQHGHFPMNMPPQGFFPGAPMYPPMPYQQSMPQGGGHGPPQSMGGEKEDRRRQGDFPEEGDRRRARIDESGGYSERGQGGNRDRERDYDRDRERDRGDRDRDRGDRDRDRGRRDRERPGGRDSRDRDRERDRRDSSRDRRRR